MQLSVAFLTKEDAFIRDSRSMAWLVQERPIYFNLGETIRPIHA